MQNFEKNDHLNLTSEMSIAFTKVSGMLKQSPARKRNSV